MRIASAQVAKVWKPRHLFADTPSGNLREVDGANVPTDQALLYQAHSSCRCTRHCKKRSFKFCYRGGCIYIYIYVRDLAKVRPPLYLRLKRLCVTRMHRQHGILASDCSYTWRLLGRIANGAVPTPVPPASPASSPHN